MKLRGMIPALVTPLTSDERIDEEGFRRLIDHNLKVGVHGLFILGSMGSFDVLRGTEKVKVANIATMHVKGKVPIIAGVSDTSTKRVIENIKSLSGINVDYYSVLPPFYSYYSQKEIEIFYNEVADASDKPIFIYNNPILTKYKIDIKTILKLRSNKNIVGLKDSDENIDNYRDNGKLFKNDPEFTYLIGSERLVLLGIEFGADGAIGGLQSLAPHLSMDIWNGIMENDYKKAVESQKKIIGLLQIATCGNFWGGVEVAYRELGICNKITASPRYAMTDVIEINKIKEIIKECCY